ncbi:thermonuclease family protein [Myxosarcina sp. GI1]|uniref:thermonuclease family protein n=1 Tax=Myxosarcina sp. GI1 TaxID=1541065 RepID=UPI000563FA71|nr:thermonuclease family protein [Myxosarcina sp. GI1]
MRTITVICASLLISNLTSVSVVASSILENVKVVSIGDGDTIRIEKNSQTITIRLGCIDAPESRQNPYGNNAKARLQELLPVGQSVSYQVIDTDRYDRTVAEVYRRNQSINLTMVKEGHAVVYHQYLNGCKLTKDSYLAAENNAKQKRLNFWSASELVMPWDFRKGRSSSSQPTANQNNDSNCDASYPDVCIPPYPPDLNCGDISFRRFKVKGSDPHNFDRDRNGIGCESN